MSEGKGHRGTPTDPSDSTSLRVGAELPETPAMRWQGTSTCRQWGPTVQQLEPIAERLPDTCCCGKFEL